MLANMLKDKWISTGITIICIGCLIFYIWQRSRDTNMQFYAVNERLAYLEDSITTLKETPPPSVPTVHHPSSSPPAHPSSSTAPSSSTHIPMKNPEVTQNTAWLRKRRPTPHPLSPQFKLISDGEIAADDEKFTDLGDIPSIHVHDEPASQIVVQNSSPQKHVQFTESWEEHIGFHDHVDMDEHKPWDVEHETNNARTRGDGEDEGNGDLDSKDEGNGDLDGKDEGNGDLDGEGYDGTENSNSETMFSQASIHGDAEERNGDQIQVPDFLRIVKKKKKSKKKNHSKSPPTVDTFTYSDLDNDLMDEYEELEKSRTHLKKESAY